MVDVIGAFTGLFAVLMPVWIIWIIVHYRSTHKSRAGISEEESKQLEELMAIADNMAERIKTLESILDDEVPEWREYGRDEVREEERQRHGEE